MSELFKLIDLDALCKALPKIVSIAHPWGTPGAWPEPGNYDVFHGDEVHEDCVVFTDKGVRHVHLLSGPYWEGGDDCADIRFATRAQRMPPESWLTLARLSSDE